MNTSTLHIKVDPKLARGLKNLARKRNVPVGELVRQAVASSYQLELAELPDHQQKAVSAYQGGYISTGKLAQEMGMSVMKVREWLAEHDIPQNNAYSEEDLRNA